ncbi:membrane protein [Pseudidiomarina salinarum]|uniref:D-2-hydroxyglutarate dehydrogenase n=1 Tax=Pseudidiomarina salinarum TaxID=435908 RepID=A0A094LAE0_9GAMM|nr:FAD-binding and (Fe-S)-binding domain-containing protein [Pseudidiomarina salinarum]KFZ31808.1 membrane protein [Pseudidiomarina salinarum]
MTNTLPVHDQHSQPEPGYQSYLAALKTAGFDGDIDASYAGRLIAATDNSIYQQLPQAVLYPRSRQALSAALKLARSDEFKPLRFTPRGGGTGTNGQALAAGVVIDLSRYFKEITEVSAADGWVRCQAGVIKDQLNDAIRSAGWFFSPDLSTSNRATIGGMINTDASGQGSLVYGKTSDHILELTAVLICGEVIHTRPVTVTDALKLAEGSSTEAAIYRQVLATAIGQRSAIEAKFPPLNRFLTGYDIKHCYDPDAQTIDLSRLLAGSEGTLAFITDARLKLTPIPRHKLLVTVKYSDFQSALRHAPALVRARATSVETIDSNVLNLARQDIIWHQVKEQLREVVGGAAMDGINIVEFTATDADEIEDKLNQLTSSLDQDSSASERTGVLGYQICRDAASIQTIYAMRKKAVGLLGATKGQRKPVAFVEDTAVPPENLADFIMEFRGILDAHGLHYGMFGHVDAGVLHVRPALDMTNPTDEALIRLISDKVVALTMKYGGLLWGEHGKGYRSEYSPEFFGAALYAELQKIKAVFDPHNRLNPGKICTPWHSDEKLLSIDETKRGFYDRQIPLDVRESYRPAMDCNGNGLCFNYAADSAMCPSYKATGDRRYSPKGRAGLIREWLRLNQHENFDARAIPETGKSGLLRRRKGAAPGDFNHEIKQSMDACLACKACASQCPVKVDVPAFRSRFLAWYHQRYRRPLADYLVGSIERTAPLLARYPRTANLLTHNPLSRWLMARAIGYVDAPRLSVPDIVTRWQQRNWPQYSAAQLAKLSAEERAGMVVIVQDPFTSFYEAEVVEAFGRVAEKLGFTPVLLDFIGNGKAQHVKGFLREFRHTAEQVTAQLQILAELELPMVGMDASTVLCLADEYHFYVPAAKNFSVQLVQSWLSQQAESLARLKPAKPVDTDFILLTHCTEQTAVPQASADWQSLFSAVGLQVRPLATGCCGMAGTYGHELPNQANSKKLYQLSWADKVAQAGAEGLLVTGFSCRSQVKRMSAAEKNNLQRARHPLQVLAEQL